MRRARRTRTGLTFIEVVVSVALLAGMASVVLGAVTLMENAAAREIHRLNAMEVAHRVIVQIIDDHKWIKRNKHLPVEMNGHLYVFTHREDVLSREEGLDEAEGADRSNRRTSRPAAEASLDERLKAQIHEVTITVYLERADGSRSEQPYAELTRVYNPIMGEGNRGVEWFTDLLQEQYEDL